MLSLGSTMVAALLSEANKDECERRSCTLRLGPMLLSTPVPALIFFLTIRVAIDGSGVSLFISRGCDGFGGVEGPITKG